MVAGAVYWFVEDEGVTWILQPVVMVKIGDPLTTYTFKFPLTSVPAGPLSVRSDGDTVNGPGPGSDGTVSVTGTVTVPLIGAVTTMVIVP